MAIAQRPSVGRPEQVAWPYTACCGRAGGVDVADEEACESRQAGRSPLFERDRRIVDHKTEFCFEAVVWTRVLERVEEFAEQLGKLVALGLAEAGEQLLSVGEVLGTAGLKQLSPTVCEGHQGATAVVWVGAALREPAVDEAIDP